MSNRLIKFLLLVLAFTAFSQAANLQPFSSSVRVMEYEQEHTDAQAICVNVAGQKTIAIEFTGTHGLHYYADGDLALSVIAQSQGISFGEMIKPPAQPFKDPATGKNVPVFMGDFTIIIPIDSWDDKISKADVNIVISAFACTDEVCLRPVTREISIPANFADESSWTAIQHESAQADGDLVEVENSDQSWVIMAGYLLLAIVAGFSFNLMPCVLPILPLVITRLVNQSQENRSKSISLGVAFCAGIISFFMVFGIISILFELITGGVFNWSDQFRYPSFVISMSLFIVVFALFMFDVFTLVIPSSIASKSSQGGGFAASIGMGFFAALLSTPCTGAIIGVVLVWSQTQPWLIDLLVFSLMGIGMAVPYAILVAFPSLLKSLPKPGTWMENLRKAMGFVLLIIAVKLFGALPKERLIHALYFAVVLAFSFWMWGGWVNLSTPTKRKWVIRICAIVISVTAGFLWLPAQVEMVDWQEYDAAIVASAQSDGEAVVIKFTADWCTNCVVVDEKVYHDSQVAKLIEELGVLAIKADTTTVKMPATIDLKGVYGEAGNVPVTIYIAPDGTQYKLRGIFDKDELIKLLEQN